ncbi:class D beta-lactamase [Pseudohoeflea suaedae]|uniref:Beta-lactamase n=1 Tax=Pseudohoeflea suaedae TaxID=877384 RepID=A0A4R5PLF6_9HYPH|nr:class D beta-lactamase [Pseudohoeflea suaedae]TDH36168.1 class D beta-lactamase [Pseudohoeflea suaedae]
MRRLLMVSAAFLAIGASTALARTRVVCTLATDAQSGEVLLEEGDCAGRMAPASTFKIAIALMGFDSGVLQSPEAPELAFKEGYADWRPEWKQATTPARWMKYSVVWYSQQVTQTLGEQAYRRYTEAFGYGNADVSGDPGKHNGLTQAWLSSSLEISPREQVDFLRRMIGGQLPVSPEAVANTAAITDYGMKGDGWHVHGKTGAGLPRGDDGELLRGQPFGWFVGWAEKDGRKVVFARLIRDSERQETPPGFRARDGVIEALFATNGAID